MRNILTAATLIFGVLLSTVSYFFFAAPIGKVTGPSFSNPRVEFAATFFVIGVAIALFSAVVYELFPESDSD
ncbi:MAG: hypothetical protein QF357_08420 [Dehalococcoidia bacterium]|jgi:hypothetical protein|nr:hypothetical protein [Dehalococcoidia bacterium]